MGMFCITILYLKTISEILVFISIILIFNSDYFPWVTCSFIRSLSGPMTHTYKHTMIVYNRLKGTDPSAVQNKNTSLSGHYCFLTVTVYHLFAQDSN